ncbi:MAG TPA: BON domain-containing protein [Longimicrobiales bacterium]|nr:BON domain-containing protein [Longimicrobiales bacterium]
MRDFEGVLNLEELDAEAVQAVVWQELSDEPALDAGRLEVQVSDGRVRVSGRVGTDREHQRVVHVVENVLGAARFDDAVRVDETLRGRRPEAADEAAAQTEEAQPDLGKQGRTTAASAEHLRPDPEGDLYGTHDPQKAAREAQTYVPPTEPVREEEGDEQH